MYAFKINTTALIFFFITSFTQSSFSQISGGDWRQWTTINIKYQISNKFSTTFREEIRFSDNISRLKLFSSELALAYKPAKFFKAELGYRNIQKYQYQDPLQVDNTFDFEHKFMLNLFLFQKFGSFSFGYRQRIQFEYDHLFTSEEGDVEKWYSRNKFVIQYDSLKRFTPFIAAELRWQISNPKEPEAYHKWDKARWEAGCHYRINQKHSIGVFGLLQHEWNKLPEDRSTLYVVGLMYWFKFSRIEFTDHEPKMGSPE